MPVQEVATPAPGGPSLPLPSSVTQSIGRATYLRNLHAAAAYLLLGINDYFLKRSLSYLSRKVNIEPLWVEKRATEILLQSVLDKNPKCPTEKPPFL